MTSYTGTAEYRHDQDDCTGILLVNLGTTEAPTPAAVRRYLDEFLWDPRVVEMSRPLWWLILHAVILRFRPAKVAHAYRAIWSEQGSPLLAISVNLREIMQAIMGKQVDQRIEVELAMRYGKPSIETALSALRERGMRRLLVVPMYPQYSATTTASVFDEVARVLQGWRWVPELRMIQNYHDHPLYIQGLADSIRTHWEHQGQAEKLLMSFHGIPKNYCLSGDPYYCECQKTAHLLAEALELKPTQWQLTFQSRVGRDEWLQPYTDKTLQALGRDKLPSVDVICPGFSVDCLETLEEIDMQNRTLFESAGGGRYSYIPALNESPAQVELLKQLLLTHTQGWGVDTQYRAQAMGADH
ncbi:Ferrochelatase, protoheme ferro-lyase [hydrothermal vent metagenome]|uniref:Ferrochelatase, protoheme ferro-lyase n=1 Tax=hydrothermal vent metagenome TaxID=652676 RepID=A0A3B0Y228_9ZZZZ